MGVGEFSPLPGFHPFPAEKMREEWQSIIPDWLRSIQTLNQWHEHHRLPLSSPVRFALDMAITTYTRRESFFISNLHKRKVLLHGFIPFLDDSAEQKMKQLVDLGYRRIKVKLSENPPDSAILLLNHLANEFGKKTMIRADANRRWSPEQWKTIWKQLEKRWIDYVEEPLNHPEKYQSPTWDSSTPLALDESVSELEENALFELPGLKALIIKPDWFGSIAETNRLIRNAREHGKSVVFSSSYYSPVSLLFFGYWVVRAGVQNEFHGLQTSDVFDTDLFPSFHQTPEWMLPAWDHVIQRIPWESMESVHEFECSAD